MKRKGEFRKRSLNALVTPATSSNGAGVADAVDTDADGVGLANASGANRTHTSIERTVIRLFTWFLGAALGVCPQR